MDETTNLVLAFLSGPVFLGAIAAVWYYFTKVREPARMKAETISSANAYEKDRSAQEFGELAQGDSLKAVLSIQAQLITHLIESNNGHMSKLTEAVIQGDKEHTAQLEKMTAAYNQALVTLSRAAAFPAIQRSAGRRADVDDILSARVKTEAVQVTDAIAKAAAASTNPAEPTDPPGTATIAVTGQKVE